MAAQHSQTVWMDGNWLPYEKAVVPVLSHTLHYGTGVFEGIRAYLTTDKRTAIFRAKEHFDRFLASIKVLGGRAKYDSEALCDTARELIKRNGFQECYVRPLGYLGDEVKGLKLPDPADFKVAMAAWPWGKYLGDEGQAKGIRLQVSSFRRADVSTALPWAKITGTYVTSVLSRREANLHGVDESLLLDTQGFVAEGSGENLFVVQGNKLLTPPENAILPGITRDTVIRLARIAGLSVEERPMTRNQVYLADELFFTGTAVEVTPIREVDGYKIGTQCPGPVFRKLSDLFYRCVRGDLPESREWLTYI